MVGRVYELGQTLGPLFVAEGWGVPLEGTSSVPLSERDPSTPLLYPAEDPRSLMRERYPPYLDEDREVAADRQPRRPRR